MPNVVSIDSCPPDEIVVKLFTSLEPFAIPVTVKLLELSSPSASVSLSTSSLLLDVTELFEIVPSSFTELLSLFAIGVSLAPLIVTVISPVSVPPFPSSMV